MMDAELVFLEVFARLIEVEVESCEIFVEFFRWSEFGRVERWLRAGCSYWIRLETEGFLVKVLVAVGRRLVITTETTIIASVITSMAVIITLVGISTLVRVTAVTGIYDGSRVTRIRSERLIVRPERTWLILRMSCFKRVEWYSEGFLSYIFDTERRRLDLISINWSLSKTYATIMRIIIRKKGKSGY